MPRGAAHGLQRVVFLSSVWTGACVVSRLYHSASSLALGDRCPRAWFYRYVAKITEPRIAWKDIAHYVADRDGKAWRDPSDATKWIPSRARSTALGTEMHARLQARYENAPVDWHDVPGAIALSGLHFLPQPHAAQVMVEAPIGNAAIVGDVDAHAPPVGFRVAGILWAGFRDLVAYAPEEHARLGLPASDHGYALYDYKSSADIGRYALTCGALHVDFAANLYALATMTELDLTWLPARWVYFETKRRRYAEPRDAVIHKGEAFEIVAAGSERARALDAITTETDATQNTDACEEYGGCPFHHSRGGPCDARRSLLSLLPVRIPKKVGSNMALPAGITQMKPPTPPNGAPPAAGQFTPPAQGQTFAGPPTAQFQTPPQQTFAPPPAEPTAPADVAPPPPAEPTKNRKKPAAAAPPPAAPVAAVAPQAASTTELYDFVIDGDFAPLTLYGDARDVLKAAKILRAGGA
jgi:hypothetical protein